MSPRGLNCLPDWLHFDCFPATVAALLLLWCALVSVGAFGDLNDCDWTVADSVAAQQGQTQDEIEAELVRELAIKLRQFDQCIEQNDAESRRLDDSQVAAAGHTAPDHVADPAKGRQSAAEEPMQSQSNAGVSARIGDSLSGSASGGGDSKRKVAGSPANGQRSGNPSNQPSLEPTMADSETVVAAPNGVAASSERERTRPIVVEDDVARILREAAEKETDPTRKAALWQEYENYVKNL